MEMGASFVGCSDVEAYLPENLKKVKYAITVGVRLSDFIIDQISDKPTYTYFHHYRAVNTLIDQITLRGQIEIQNMGYSAMAVLPPRLSTIWKTDIQAFSSTRPPP